MTARLLITYFEIANLRCSERDIIPASVYDLLVFVCKKLNKTLKL